SAPRQVHSCLDASTYADMRSCQPTTGARAVPARSGNEAAKGPALSHGPARSNALRAGTARGPLPLEAMKGSVLDVESPGRCHSARDLSPDGNMGDVFPDSVLQ